MHSHLRTPFPSGLCLRSIDQSFSDEDEADLRDDLVERYAFDDHNPCPLSMVKPFCESVDAWLNLHEDNVAAIHCKAGKGRTGTMIAAYIVHRSGGEIDAETALGIFSKARTNNNKGVTIPSQHRCG